MAKNNIATGPNPNTGKEFYLVDVSSTKKLSYSGQSYQTRYGATKHKSSIQIIVEKSTVPNKISAWEKTQKSLDKHIQALSNRIKEYEKRLKEGESLEKLIEGTKEELRQARLFKPYDFSSLKFE